MHEAVMATLPEKKNIQDMIDMTGDFLVQTRNIVRNNPRNWGGDKLKKMENMVELYENVILSLQEIQKGRLNATSLVLGVESAQMVSNMILEEHSNEWETCSNERRKQILENVFVPHRLIVRFIEKHGKAIANKY
jgi:hypothetical protein